VHRAARAALGRYARPHGWLTSSTPRTTRFPHQTRLRGVRRACQNCGFVQQAGVKQKPVFILRAGAAGLGIQTF
jgi:hypothetical protein